MMQYRFIEPLDILNFRGNKSFGEGGEHGESRMPPMPSIFAGAIRSTGWHRRRLIWLRLPITGLICRPIYRSSWVCPTTLVHSEFRAYG